MTRRTCIKCRLEKDLSEFYNHRTSNLKQKSWTCQECHRERARIAAERYKASDEPALKRNHKVCSGCDIEKPASEFHKSSCTVDKLQAWCKECVKAYQTGISEKLPAGQKRCRSCEEVKPLDDFPSDRRTRDSRSRFCVLCFARVVSKRRARIAQGRRETYHNNIEKYRALSRKTSLDYLARKADSPVVSFTEEEWQERLAEFNNKCAYCHKELVDPQREHMIPLSRRGEHTKENIVPACQSCNSRKGAKLLPFFIAEMASHVS